MSDKFLPKSLHTVRILVAVARAASLLRDPLDAVQHAAKIIGYPNARASDPLIVKAAEQLAGMPML